LYNEYLDFLNKEELEIFLTEIKNHLSKIFIAQLEELMNRLITPYQKIKDLIEVILFIDLKYNENFAFYILNEVDLSLKSKVIRFLILHLNYHEYIPYKIPYGKFFIYFEKLLDFIYKNHPEIECLLKIIDSGFMSGAVSLSEKYSYGSISYHKEI
jgi:hypothetical protein